MNWLQYWWGRLNDVERMVAVAVQYGLEDHLSPEGAAYFWLSKPYATADGRHAALTDFTYDDWAYNATIAAGKAAGWTARQGLFELGREAMKANPKAQRTVDLPKVVLQRLEAAAGAAH